MVYTKTGDKGTTSLVGGRRVKKSDLRVEAYGSVDELNSHLGLLATMLDGKSKDLSIDFDVREQFDICHSQLQNIQNKLFIIQTLLATEDEETYKKLTQLETECIASMERWIDTMEAKLPRLNSFVIAGGTIESAQAHVARTVCRRAEREMVRLSEVASVEENLLGYINRTSDYLFVLSRFILILENKKENFWSAE